MDNIFVKNIDNRTNLTSFRNIWHAMLVIALVGITYIPLKGQSNEGTRFWMGFMEKFELGEEERVLMITSRFDTDGLISIPLQGWQTPFTVNANEIRTISIPQFAVPIGSEKITETGIEITSNDPIVVYAHQYETNRAEASAILPISSLGTTYYALGYQGYTRENSFTRETEEYPSQFLIVATQNNTRITYQVSSPTIEGLNPGDTRTITLNPGETYQVQAAGGESGDLSGSLIQSDKPIAVYSGNLWTQVPNGCNARDNLYEQMYPTSTWGRQFIAVHMTQTDFSILRILSATDNNSVQLSGNVNQTLNLEDGQWDEITHTGPVYIQASEPVLVAQFSTGRDCNGHPGGLGDPSMVLLNSVEQTRDTVTFFSSPFQNIFENYVNVVVRSVDVDNVFLDGNPLNDQAPFQDVPSIPSFSYTTVEVDAGPHTLTAAGCGLNASIYGYGDAESYAYAAGAFFRPINPEKFRDLTGGCSLDTLEFDSGLAEDIFTFQWEFGDGNSSTSPVPLHTYQNPGIYLLTLMVNNICLDTEETFRQPLIINEKPDLLAGNDTAVCLDQPVMLSASLIPDATYQWSGPMEFDSTERQPIILNASTENSGTYQVIATVNNCSSDPDSTRITLLDTPVPNLGEDTVLCPGDSLILYPGNFESYRWQDGSDLPKLIINQGGTYWVETRALNGCTSTDSLRILEACPLRIFIPTAFSPNGDGFNDQFMAKGNYVERFHMIIYDRWGNRLFETHDMNESWQGIQRNGEPAPEGVYVWNITFEGISEQGNTFSQQQRGTVTLLR